MAHSKKRPKSKKQPKREKGQPQRGEARRPEGGPPPAAAPMASSVTRHREISGKEKEGKDGKGEKHEKAERELENKGGILGRFVSCGIDSLDLGFYVFWGDGWDRRLAELEALKKEARGNGQVLWDDDRWGLVMVAASGKPPMYRYHIQHTLAHIFIGKRQAPGKGPNVYVSIKACALWTKGVRESVDEMKEFIKQFGGYVHRVQVSRADLCADFLIPAGLSSDFVASQIVAQSHATRAYEDYRKLETFYLGAGSGMIQLRIYDKGKEVKKSGQKDWFLPVWDLDNAAGVWRVEFQLRRGALKQFRIEGVGALLKRWGELWKHLTEHWASLRLPDNENPTRRTVHLWWQEVQECGGRFVECQPLERDYETESKAKLEWYRSHIIGLLVGYAAHRGTTSWSDALALLGADIQAEVEDTEFIARVLKKTIALGRILDPRRRIGV
jgi:replication protein CRI